MTRKSTIVVLGALLGLYAASQASAAADQVVIGDIDDMSGVYADVLGQAGLISIDLAIQDFGGTVLGKKITVLSVDHQNKPDIGASKFREWADQNGLTMVLGGSNTGVSIAMSKVAAAKKIPFIAVGAGGASLTGADCTRLHRALRLRHDRTRQWHGQRHRQARRQDLVLRDRRLRLRHAAAGGRDSRGAREWRQSVGRGSGAARHDRLLLVPAAGANLGAQVLGLANAGTDFSNSLKAANEFGITKTMKPAALLAFLTDIHALTLQTAQGLYLTTAWYWDLNDQTRAFAKRFFAKVKRMPTMDQAGYYSATMQYLNAVKAVGSTDSDKVMAQLKKTKINDMFTQGGYVRADGLMVHTMYVMQVKTPAESKYPWDYYKVVKVLTGEEADGAQPDQTCPMIKK